MLIAVVGVATAAPDELKAAREVGRLIAEHGHILICGGCGGVMEAAARGADDAGGITVGILPGDSPKDANPWITVPLATGLGEARNAIITRAAHGLIAIGTGWGTLSEIALGIRMGKPVVAVGESAAFLQEFGQDAIRWAESPTAAVTLLLDMLIAG